jgi:hypothetical protein
MCSFYLPLAVMVILYTRIYITARRIILKVDAVMAAMQRRKKSA